MSLLKSGKSGKKLFIVSFMFASIQVFSSIQLDGTGFYANVIMKPLRHIVIIDNSTSTGMIRVPLNMGRTQECRELSGNFTMSVYNARASPCMLC